MLARWRTGLEFKNISPSTITQVKQWNSTSMKSSTQMGITSSQSSGNMWLQGNKAVRELGGITS